jgi:osmoprotectant transport system substrate-binding protein
MRNLVKAAAVIAVVLLAAACGSSGGSGSSSGSSGSSQASSAPGNGKPTIILGDKNFDEEYVLGDIYAQAFQAKGYTVQVKQNIGGSELINSVFQSGKINAYPEYDGEIVSTNAGDDKPIATDAETQKLAETYEAKHGATFLTPVTPFFDTDVLFTLKPYAKAHHLTAVGDLKNVGSAKYGAYSSELTRYTGYVGLKEAYGLTSLQFVPLAAGSPIYNAVDNGQVQVGDAFSTDPQLLSGKYQTLTDTKNIFGFQHVGLVIKSSLLKQLGPQFQQVYAAVTRLLTTPVMQALNKAVALDQQDPAAVAKAFLQANHMLG